MAFIRSISGLRATIGDGLIPEVIAKYAAAYATFLPPGDIFIGRDGRPTGEWIEQIVAGCLTACGRNVNLLGIVPTPTVQLMVEQTEAAGGIIITASHNPMEWNGLKFLSAEGIFLDKEENEKMWDIVDNDKMHYSTVSTELPDFMVVEEVLESHIHDIMHLPMFSESGMADKIKEQKYHVVVDAVNASGSEAIPHLLEHFGCKVTGLYTEPTGVFPHTPEPIPANLGDLAKAVKENKADFGIAVDPDADRLVLIDDNGEPIGEEKTVCIAIDTVLNAKEYLGKSDDLSVAVNYSTTRLVEDIAAMHGAKVFRSPVGEINVVKKMKENNAVIGGEGSGGVIFPSCHYGRDSLVGAALVLYLLTLKNKKLSEIASEYPKYEVIKLKKEFSGDLTEIIDKIVAEFSDAEVIKDDGVKVNYPKSWVQLRASNTEPIVRIIAEAPTMDEAKKLSDKVMGLL